MQDFQKQLDTVYKEINELPITGKVASYIPELSCISPTKFGIHLVDINQNTYSAGDSNEFFSVQSISKVLSLAFAMECVGPSIWNRVGVEPSGDPFNHLSLLELENGIPRNPFINAGAIVIADILVGQLAHPKEDFLEFVRQLANDPTITYDKKVAQSEKQTGFKNYAAAHLLKSYGNLTNTVDEVLDFYFHQCALQMSCAQLCNAFYMFTNRGTCQQNVNHLNINQIKRVNALMLTCGFYDEAGEFAFEVGLPGKSGVGGGIVALLPNQYCVTTWSPALNAKGNSAKGMAALERFTTLTNLSIF